MPGHDATNVNIHLRTAETGENRAGVSGIYRCGSPWLCPVCAVGKAHERAERVQIAANATFARGGAAALVVLTASHSRDTTLGQIKTLVQGASSAARKGRAWIVASRDFGILGVVVGQEVTYSVTNGWHYHQHLSVMIDGPRDAETSADVRDRAQAAGSWIAKAYTAKVRAAGGKVSDRHGWHVRVAIDANDASNYTAKGSMAWEISGAHKDETRAETSITPWDIAVAASSGDAAMFDRWREYVDTMPGTRSCVISAALAKELGINVAAETEEGEHVLHNDDEVVGRVDAPVWRKWMRHGLAATFLSRVEYGGEDGFSAAVDQTEIDAEPLEAEYQRLRAARAAEWRLEHDRKTAALQQEQAASRAKTATEFAKAYALDRLRCRSEAYGTRDRINMVIEQAAGAFPGSRRLTFAELYKAAV